MKAKNSLKFFIFLILVLAGLIYFNQEKFLNFFINEVRAEAAGGDGGDAGGGDSGATGGGDSGSSGAGDSGTPAGGDTGAPAGGDTGAPAGGDTGAPAGGDTGAPAGEDAGVPSVGEDGAQFGEAPPPRPRVIVPQPEPPPPPPPVVVPPPFPPETVVLPPFPPEIPVVVAPPPFPPTVAVAQVNLEELPPTGGNENSSISWMLSIIASGGIFTFGLEKILRRKLSAVSIASRPRFDLISTEELVSVLLTAAYSLGKDRK